MPSLVRLIPVGRGRFSLSRDFKQNRHMIGHMTAVYFLGKIGNNVLDFLDSDGQPYRRSAQCLQVGPRRLALGLRGHRRRIHRELMVRVGHAHIALTLPERHRLLRGEFVGALLRGILRAFRYWLLCLLRGHIAPCASF